MRQHGRELRRQLGTTPSHEPDLLTSLNEDDALNVLIQNQIKSTDPDILFQRVTSFASLAGKKNTEVQTIERSSRKNQASQKSILKSVGFNARRSASVQASQL